MSDLKNTVKDILKRVAKALFSTVSILLVGSLAVVVAALSSLFSGGGRWYKVMVSIDQTANTLLGGSEDETISARCYLHNYRQPYTTLEKVINFLFKITIGQKDHCFKAFESESKKLIKRGENYGNK